MLAHLRDFLSTVPGSIAGILSNKDRAYALITALSTGNVAGVVTALIAGLGLSLSGQAVGVITALVIAIWNAGAYYFDANRRKAQGVSSGRSLDAAAVVKGR